MKNTTRTVAAKGWPGLTNFVRTACNGAIEPMTSRKPSPIRVPWWSMAVAAVIALHSRPVACAEGADPKTLLQGVEGVRLQIPPSRLLVRTLYRDQSGSPPAWNLKIEFDGDHRLVAQTAPKAGYRALFDGSNAIHFDGADSVTVRGAHDQNSDYNFDPRLLGLTTTYRWADSLSKVLPYREASRLEALGEETVAGAACSHVRIHRPKDLNIDLWIDARHNFRVHRYELRVKGVVRCTADSFYENVDYAWLPSRVESRHYGAGGSVNYVRSFSILEAKANVKLPPETWTLEGLRPKVGASVTDLPAKRRLGYWDGVGLSQERLDVPRHHL